MDIGALRIRWELHTEFVTWTFSVAAPQALAQAPEPAIGSVPQDWVAALPRRCLCGLHLWVLPAEGASAGRPGRSDAA